jgi:hypothetical protein
MAAKNLRDTQRRVNGEEKVMESNVIRDYALWGQKW